MNDIIFLEINFKFSTKKLSLISLESSGKSKTVGNLFIILSEYHLMHQAAIAGIMWINTDARFGISCKIKAFLSKSVAPEKGPKAAPQKM